MDFGLWTHDFGLRTLDLGLRAFKAIFLPDFPEALALAIIIAKHVDSVVLPQPAVQLGEELAPLRFRHRGFQRAVG